MRGCAAKELAGGGNGEIDIATACHPLSPRPHLTEPVLAPVNKVDTQPLGNSGGARRAVVFSHVKSCTPAVRPSQPATEVRHTTAARAAVVHPKLFQGVFTSGAGPMSPAASKASSWAA